MRKYIASIVVLTLIAFGFALFGNKNSAQVKAQILRVGVVGNPTTDPIKAATFDDLAVVDQLYTRLVKLNEDFQPVPALAKSWKVSADKKTWTFNLAENRTFSNGKSIHADDVKASLERVESKKSTSPASAVLEVVKGFRQFHDEGNVDSMSGLVVTSKFQLKIELEEPWSDLPAALASPYFGITPGEEDGKLITSGLFGLTSETKTVKTLTPRSPTGLKGMRFNSYKTDDALLKAYQDEVIDVARFNARTVEGAKDVKTDRLAATLFYGINAQEGVLKSPMLREAITHGIDRKKIVNEVYGKTFPQIEGVVGEPLPGATEDPCGETCDYDLALAKKNLRHKFPKGNYPTLRLSAAKGVEAQEEILEMLKADLEKVGFKIDINRLSTKKFRDLLRSGEQEVFQLARVAEYSSADATLWPLFSTGSADNVVGLKSKRTNAFISSYRKQLDLKKRTPIYTDAEQQALKNAVIIPFVQLEARTGVRTYVHGYATDPLGSFNGAAVSMAN